MTVNSPKIPSAQSQVVDQNQRMTVPWWRYLFDFDRSTREQIDALISLQYQIDNLPASNSAVWGLIEGTLSNQSDLQAVLNLLAPLLSPAFTGTPTAPTPSSGDSSTKLATTAFVGSAGTASITPTLLATGETFNVPLNKQVLFTIPIDIADGTLDVVGELVEVA